MTAPRVVRRVLDDSAIDGPVVNQYRGRTRPSLDEAATFDLVLAAPHSG